jgi:hypothetical protein
MMKGRNRPINVPTALLPFFSKLKQHFGTIRIRKQSLIKKDEIPLQYTLSHGTR